MKANFENNYEVKTICPICGRVCTLKHIETSDVVIGTDNDMSISMQHIPSNIIIECRHCRVRMIRCKDETEIYLVKSIIELGFALESYGSGHLFSKILSVNVDTKEYREDKLYVSPSLNFFVPVNDIKKCINAARTTRDYFKNINEITYSIYPNYEYSDDERDEPYYDINAIIDCLEKGNQDFSDIQIIIHIGYTISGEIKRDTEYCDKFVQTCIGYVDELRANILCNTNESQ